MQLSFRLGGAVLLLALGACRSQQTAFSFRPAPALAAAPPATVPGRPAPVATPDAAPVAPASARALVATPPAVSAPAAVQPAARVGRPVAVRRPLLRPRREVAAVARPQRPTRHDTLHIVLGALLVVGGVVAGLALGGWLGLGVGAAIVLLGYYFVVLGIGGKHAWLEIFQEFFNM